jgi:hypothetical protein
MHLYEILAQRVDQWRSQSYPHPEYSTIAEILEWSANPEGDGFRLRPPQLRALETYWYLRLIENTPHIFDLYRQLFIKQTELLEAFGLGQSSIKDYVMDYGLESLFDRIRTDDEFIRSYHLEALRETLTLAYPSYILALAMGVNLGILRQAGEPTYGKSFIAGDILEAVI